jgi:DNA-binding MarR family transcriptional regulator
VRTTKTISPETARAAGDLRLSVGRIARRLRQSHTSGDLSMSESSVLSRLDREGLATPGKLADCERVRPQAMGVTLAALEQRGLVRRSPDAEDGRRVVMTVTEEGLAVLRDRRLESVQKLGRAMEDEFTAAERRKLAAVLPLLDRLAERL